MLELNESDLRKMKVEKANVLHNDPSSDLKKNYIKKRPYRKDAHASGYAT